MKILKVAVALGLATSLSGCLSDDKVKSAVDPIVADGAIDPVAVFSLYERYEADDATPADPNALPSSATMSGYISAFIDSDEYGLNFVGDMNVEADFENGAMTGTATNIGLYQFEGFCESNDDCEITYVNGLDGELVMSNGIITGNGFTADLNGTISGDYSDPDLTGTMVSDIFLTTTMGGGGFWQDSEGLIAYSDLIGTADTEFTTEEGPQNIVSDLNGGMIVAD